MFEPFDPEVSAVFAQTLQRCEEELRAIQSDKAALAEREVALLKQVRNLRELIAARNGSLSIAEAGSQIEMISVDLSGESKAETIARETAEILQRLGRPTHYAELYEILKTKVPLGGRSPAATLLAYLNKDSARFARVARGTYWLATEPIIAKTIAPPRSRKSKTRRRRARRKQKISS